MGILGNNSVEWFASSIGAVFAGYEVVLVTELSTNAFTIFRGLPTGMYTTNSTEDCLYVLKDSKATLVVVENQKFLDKILEVCDIGHLYC